MIPSTLDDFTKDIEAVFGSRCDWERFKFMRDKLMLSILTGVVHE